MLAAMAVGQADTTHWNGVAAQVEPDPAVASQYEELYGVYRSLYPATVQQAICLRPSRNGPQRGARIDRTGWPMSLLGIDVGTSAVKVVAFEADAGSTLASARVAYPSSYPGPGLMELDPELVWTGFVEAVRAVTASDAVGRDPSRHSRCRSPATRSSPSTPRGPCSGPASWGPIRAVPMCSP